LDVEEIRLRNYKVLLRQFREREEEKGEPERGVLARFGAFAEVSPRYLSHVNNGRKHLGADVCRRFERAFRLPHGWMDHDHLGGPGPGSRAEREFLELALKLYRESPVEAQGVLLRYMAGRIVGAVATEESAGDAGKRGKPGRRG
jgi:hypothetical protein